ncbi:MAG: hypothetical protein FWF71_00010 [Actinomycetia bacterium]|nr:hypothetical protein [Actinomycetes bacterium]
MKARKLFSIALVSVVLTLVLAGCSGMPESVPDIEDAKAAAIQAQEKLPSLPGINDAKNAMIQMQEKLSEMAGAPLNGGSAGGAGS